ncbi:MAG: S1 RNA-binding domain-containing protein, partial [Proteobacteria bacterium]|nr:S1 RNA-binding domain-containing protein [Pseudomonadota bacterium]
VGKTFHFLINQYEESGKNIVVSRRDLLNEEIKEKQKAFFEKTKEGDTVQGTVTKLMPFGAFVEISSGVEGMVHISELSWSRIEKPEEIVKTGENVTVKILKIEPGKDSGSKKISLSMRQASENPWDTVSTRFHVGDQFTGKVVRLAAFGAFVEIAPGVDGLVHISEMSHTKRVLRPEDEVGQGDQVQVVVKSIDMDSKRISLSMKDAHGDPWTGIGTKYPVGSVVEGVLEKKEKFGLFITLEPGITGLMPASNISNAADPSVFEKLRPSDSIQVMIQTVDEEQRRITLGSPDQKDQDNWKQFAQEQKSSSFGSLGDVFQKAMKKESDRKK